MRIFEKDDKINFVDENNVFLGYDMGRWCCENAEWFIAETPCAHIKNRNGRIPNLDGFVFDPAFFKSVENSDFENGKMAIFRITNGKEEKFIHIYNVHNGYYSHGFQFGKDQKISREDSL